MNWQAISFDWNQIRAFLATVEEGSLSGAARALGSTQPTVGRQVTGLEEALGVTLFERGGRSLAMTGAAQDLLEHVQAMGEAASRVSMVASGQSQDIAGTVTITASDLLAAQFLPDVLVDLRKQAPGIDVHVVASNRIENLTRREADIAIRHVRPDQPDLIAKHVSDMAANLYGSVDYFAARGLPPSADNLRGHDLIGPPDIDLMVASMAAFGFQAAPTQFRARSDSGVMMWQMMKAGLGMCVLPDKLCADDPLVRKAIPDHPPVTFPAWLATHRELKTSKRIRIVFDMLAEALARK